jgi:nicotinate-nucleotide adenylyltransferase
MVKIAVESFDEFSVSNYEIEKGGLSFTSETLQYFKGENEFLNEEKELFFITGADCLISMEKWRDVQKIFSLATLVVFARGGISKKEMMEKKKIIEEKYNGKIIILDLKELEISSTDIRDRVNQNKRIDFFVPPKVVNFIYEKELYHYEL